MKPSSKSTTTPPRPDPHPVSTIAPTTHLEANTVPDTIAEPDPGTVPDKPSDAIQDTSQDPDRALDGAELPVTALSVHDDATTQKDDAVPVASSAVEEARPVPTDEGELQSGHGRGSRSTNSGTKSPGEGGRHHGSERDRSRDKDVATRSDSRTTSSRRAAADSDRRKRQAEMEKKRHTEKQAVLEERRNVEDERNERDRRRRELAQIQHDELAAKYVADELARRLTEWVERKCTLILQSEAVQQSLADRLEAERAKMEAEVDAELVAEKALAEEEKQRAHEEIKSKRLELEQLQQDRKRQDEALLAKKDTEQAKADEERFLKLKQKLENEKAVEAEKQAHLELQKKQQAKILGTGGRKKLSFSMKL